MNAKVSHTATNTGAEAISGRPFVTKVDTDLLFREPLRLQAYQRHSRTIKFSTKNPFKDLLADFHGENEMYFIINTK